MCRPHSGAFVRPPRGISAAAFSLQLFDMRERAPLASADRQETRETFGWAIDFANGVPIYRQITNRVLNLATLGLIKPDEALPSIRTLALELKVAPNTISRAYEELECAGVVHKRRGLGTFVSFEKIQTVDCERQRIIEQQINALLAEARHLNFTPEALLQLMLRQLALLSRNWTVDKGS